ncbi:MAG: hypothetical protein ACR2IL_01115 [Chitinophagaceae bacterium]
MKSVRLFLVAAGFMALATSCEKTYTCSCTFPGQSNRDFDITLPEMRHNDAKVACQDYNYHMDSVSNGNCTLK